MNSRPTRSSKRSPSARRAILTWIAGIVALTAGPAIAVDGVIEINQDKVVAAGGFPFIISVSGSYRLTSNLTSTATAIGVAVSEVTIDLNGFSVVGSNTGNGIEANFRDKIAIHNGAVSGFFEGIVANGKGTDIQHVRLFANGDSGITCGAECLVSSATINGGNYGIIAGNTSRILSNAVELGDTANTGIDCAGRCIISSNTISGGHFGIKALELGRITENVFHLNIVGITAGGAHRPAGEISGNTINQGQPGFGFGSIGIDVGGGLVDHNYVSEHEIALSCESPVGYLGNVFHSLLSITSGPRVSMGNNLCASSPC